MQAQVLPGENLKHLFERAEAAGQDEKGIGEFSHLGLTGMHGGSDVQFGKAAVRDLEFNERFRNNSDDSPLTGETGFGDGFHQAYIGATIDNTDVLFGETSAQRDSGLYVERIRAVRGGAEDGCIADHSVKNNNSRFWQYEFEAVTELRPLRRCPEMGRRLKGRMGIFFDVFFI